MDSRRSPHVLTIPPGVPFLRELVSALMSGALYSGFRHDPDDALALSRLTIFVPTRRAARELRSEFVDFLGGRSAILPVIKPLGETEEDDDYFDAGESVLLDLAPPINGTAKLIELARLILAWRNRLPEIVRSIHHDTPLVAPASPADAIWLARALVELIDAVETEERDWQSLGDIRAENFANWWQLTLEFLKIASAFWPERLAEIGRSSPVRHRNALLRAEARRMQGLAGQHPVIVAGSTGSIPAAAELIASIAQLPNGLVVLPGLDTGMPDADWQLAGGAALSGQSADPASRSHPQYGLHQLLGKLGVERADIVTLRKADPDLADRAEVLSRAMAPAEATDAWMDWRLRFQDERIEAAFADVSLIEAANEREEATAIAVALRLGLEQATEHGDARVALVTPDRKLARRVRAELARFGIEADDTAGTPLSATPQGSLLQLLLEAAIRHDDIMPLAALLKHPLARFGLEAGVMRSAGSALELLALRGGNGGADPLDLPGTLEAALARQAGDRHPPEWRRNLPEDAAEIARDLAGRVQRALQPLTEIAGDEHAIAHWAEISARALEVVCEDERRDLAALWSGEAGDKLADLFEQIMLTDGHLEADGRQWIDVIAAFSAGVSVKPRAMRHPRVFIFGTLEARLQQVDTIVLGGLNEGSWPGQTVNNPFLSRTMKTGIGLEPPERRIGQLAHDFEMASGTRNLIYSRALRQGTTPTVASRWLQRLLALGGGPFAAQLRGRGDTFRDYARLLDQGESQRSASRPMPKPAPELQPRQYSFSEVGRLRRDPYSIYARRILRLDPLQSFNGEPGAAERGTLYHRIVERYVRELPDGEDGTLALMMRIADTCFAEMNLPHHLEILWRHRFRETARPFVDWHAGRRPSILRTLTEVPAGFELPEAGIRLTGIADRIDLKAGGFADIIDYKTGSNPSPAQARSLLDPQLPLEAAALEAAAFKLTGRHSTENLIYVRLRPGTRFAYETVNNEMSGKGDKAKSASELGADATSQLVAFVNLLRSGERGFASRLVPFMQGDLTGDYDHLARVAEWSTADASEEAPDE